MTADNLFVMPEPIVTEQVTYYASSEVVTGRTNGWETYKARCVSARTPQEALERFHRGEGAKISGKRRVKRLTGDCSVDCLDACAYPGQFSECSS